MALGDITRRQKQRLRAAYMGLERPNDRIADATFLRHMRRLNYLREAIWEERRHMLDPSLLAAGLKSSRKARNGL